MELLNNNNDNMVSWYMKKQTKQCYICAAAGLRLFNLLVFVLIHWLNFLFCLTNGQKAENI